MAEDDDGWDTDLECEGKRKAGSSNETTEVASNVGSHIVRNCSSIYVRLILTGTSTRILLELCQAESLGMIKPGSYYGLSE
jgi:hypothetical protein